MKALASATLLTVLLSGLAVLDRPIEVQAPLHPSEIQAPVSSDEVQAPRTIEIR